MRSLPNVMLLDCRQALLCAALCAPAAWCLLAWATRRPRRRDTGFEAFLKAGDDAGAQRSAADFGSFLRKAAPAPNAADAQAEPAAVEEAGPRPGDAAVAVLYGTEYGASKEIAEGLCQRLRAAGAYWWACLAVRWLQMCYKACSVHPPAAFCSIRPRLMDMAEHPDGLDLSSEAALLMICSTQVRGGRQTPRHAHPASGQAPLTVPCCSPSGVRATACRRARRASSATGWPAQPRRACRARTSPCARSGTRARPGPCVAAVRISRLARD